MRIFPCVLLALLSSASAFEDLDDLMALCEANITSKNQQKKQRFLDNFQLVREKLVDLQVQITTAHGIP